MSQSTNATQPEFRLVVHRPSASTIEHKLENGRSVFLGTGGSCGIQVRGEGIAEIHCLIDVDGEKVTIQDWASEGGTHVNDQRIEDRTPLEIGDRITLGNLRIELDGKIRFTDAALDNSIREEKREPSVGMEHLGLESEAPPANTSPAVRTAPAAMNQSTGMLSDQVHSLAPHNHVELDDLDDMDQSATDDVDSADDVNIDMVEQDTFDADTEEATPSLPAEEAMQSTGPLGLGEEPFAEDPLSDHAALNADDVDWDPNEFDDDQVDAEVVSLLKAEIEDLRIQLTERDEQIATLEQSRDDFETDGENRHSLPVDEDFGGSDLVQRVDDLLDELAEHDERVSTLQELLETAEMQNQAEQEERNCLETWVGEIEKRIGQRESEWQAEQDSLRERLEEAIEQRDQFQQQLHAAAKRFGNGVTSEVVPDEALKKLQTENAELREQAELATKKSTALAKQLKRFENENSDSIQAERAELAKQKAEVSRLRFQLSKQLQELDQAPPAKDQPDREFAYKLQTLRDHLREIHEEEKKEREAKGESLLTRISGLWKRVDEEF